MRISRSEEYGLRLVMRLAKNGGRLTIRELAEHEELPEPTVAKVIGKLRRAKVVDAERGRNGGYSLLQPANRITLATVVDALGRRVYDGEFCSRMSPSGDCAHNTECGLRPVWNELGSVIGNFLEGITVADIINGNAPFKPAATGATMLPVTT